MAVAGAATLAAALCGGCLYTIVPAMAGQSTTYQQPTDSQPPQPSQTSQASQSSQQSQTSNEQTNQNKQQNGATPNGAQLQGAGGTP